MWGKGRWGGGITYPPEKGRKKKKKKKNPGINQCGEKGSGGGYYIPADSEDLKNSEPSAPSIISRIKYGYGRTNLPTQ